jgi:hypothetical protein
MSKKKRKKKQLQELNDDINWDYGSYYQGRSRRQVEDNEIIVYYAGLSLVFLIICFFLYWIFSII